MFESTKIHNAKRMWPGGPLRQFSETRGSASWTPYDTGGYVGCYVCDTCQRPVTGLYMAKVGYWCCADCTRKAKPLPPAGKANEKTLLSDLDAQAGGNDAPEESK